MPRENANSKKTFRQLLQKFHENFIFFRRKSFGVLKFCNTILFILSVIASIGCLVSIAVYFGFDHTPSELIILKRCLHTSLIVFALDIFYSWTFQIDKQAKLKNRILQLCIELPVVIAFLAMLYPHPQNPWIKAIDSIVYSSSYLCITLSVYSIIILSLAITRIINKHTNPSLMLSGSFFTIIILGALMLMLPKCNLHPLPFIDALFVSTSAVCITGLTPVDISSQFTPLGLLILAFLIQIGALGVMTFTSFFALFFSGNSSLYSQMMLKDVIYSRSMSALIPTLLYILGFTLIIEAIGAVAIWFSIHNTLGMSINEEIIFSAFHSLSSFCNAGFSTIKGGLSNPLLLDYNLSIYWITTVLIILGAIGFPILVNFRDAIFSKLNFKRNPKFDTPLHLYNMNTKIVLTFFSLLFIVGAILFFFFERNNTLAGMSFSQQIAQSAFNSAVPRSAGFSSVDPANFLSPTLIIVMFLMWVGGSSQSTAGGIKVNTLAAIYFNLKAILTGAPRVTAFKRTVAIGSVRRANAVVAISIFSYVVLAVALLALEPEIPARSLLFEACSALFTVGSSLGITSQLSSVSLALLCVAMFLGRVGIISLLVGIVPKNKGGAAQFPTDNIIIN